MRRWAHARRCSGAATCSNEEQRQTEKRNYLQCVAAHRTGSNPPALSGEQRAMRFAPIHEPFSNPYFTIASSVYREQLGSKRQLDGSQKKTTR